MAGSVKKRRVLFWDEDTQIDFIRADGKLAVPAAESIVPNLKRLTDFAVEHKIPILASVDTHTEDDPEFRQFGKHCVRGSAGQAKLAETRPERAQVVEPNLMNRQVQELLAGELSQLVLEKQKLDVFTAPMIDKVLRAVHPSGVYVYGVTTEYCVRCAVLGILERGYPVFLVLDAVKAIDETDGIKAIEEMTGAGAAPTTTEEVLRKLA